MSVNLHYEDKARSAGFSSVCGVDEAGAGPLMGPVYAAAVILPEGCEIEGLNDSKKMTEKKREALFDEICEKALAYARDHRRRGRRELIHRRGERAGEGQP